MQSQHFYFLNNKKSSKLIQKHLCKYLPDHKTHGTEMRVTTTMSVTEDLAVGSVFCNLTALQEPLPAWVALGKDHSSRHQKQHYPDWTVYAAL